MIDSMRRGGEVLFTLLTLLMLTWPGIVVRLLDTKVVLVQQETVRPIHTAILRPYLDHYDDHKLE